MFYVGVVAHSLCVITCFIHYAILLLLLRLLSFTHSLSQSSAAVSSAITALCAADSLVLVAALDRN